jgi:hypothetical protein
MGHGEQHMSTPIDLTSAEAWERGRDHAWRYFEIHAGQRMSMFNFFTVLAGITLAGIGATLQGTPSFSAIGVVLGLLLALLSFVFWKLDQRVAFLVKHAELAHEHAETVLLPPEIRLFCGEPGAHATACQNKPVHRRYWTFGRSLRFTFGAMAAIGLASTVLCGLRVAGVVGFEKPEKVETKTEQLAPGGNPAKGVDTQAAKDAANRKPLPAPTPTPESVQSGNSMTIKK